MRREIQDGRILDGQDGGAVPRQALPGAAEVGIADALRRDPFVVPEARGGLGGRPRAAGEGDRGGWMSRQVADPAREAAVETAVV
jgi:hypothetical protein